MNKKQLLARIELLLCCAVGAGCFGFAVWHFMFSGRYGMAVLMLAGACIPCRIAADELTQ